MRPLTVGPKNSLRILATTAALCSAAATAFAADVNSDYITPQFTFSPDDRYGVTIPVFHFDAAQEPDARTNQVVELSSQRVVAVIRQRVPGYDRALNFHETVPPRWSADSTLLLWKVAGKWCPDSLVLLKIEQDHAKWQIDLLKTAQQAVLSRTREAAPKQYTVAKKSNAGNGSAFPEGFTIDVTTDGENGGTVSLPLGVHAQLTANPKQIEGKPNLDSRLDAIVTPDGKFMVKHFQLVPHIQ
jgi:hypothetical protein